ncbi:Hypothetical predicted protein [Cloeon dipterum]|uniref:Uncharacterized protein n=1 Tax=Cloeon dipterum TaxID=197152 RepID=A0A8S1DAS6_9INSE|nr:Hypothetical predicted protein [Cloeon dipterum]
MLGRVSRVEHRYIGHNFLLGVLLGYEQPAREVSELNNGDGEKGVAHPVAKRVERPFPWRSTKEEKTFSSSPNKSLKKKALSIQFLTQGLEGCRYGREGGNPVDGGRRRDVKEETPKQDDDAEKKPEETKEAARRDRAARHPHRKKAEFIESTSAPVNEEVSEPLAEPELEEKKEEEAVAPEVAPVKPEALSEPVQKPTAAFVAAVTKPEPEAEVEEEAVTSAKEDSDEVAPEAKAADTE